MIIMLEIVMTRKKRTIADTALKGLVRHAFANISIVLGLLIPGVQKVFFFLDCFIIIGYD